MHYHIILTEKCNSRCKYCYEKSLQEFGNSLSKKFNFNFNAPCNLEIDIEKLKNFIQLEDVLIFYGGEPLLNLENLIKIMDAFPKNRFCLQTNGKLLDKVPLKYMNRFSRILVSIDGDKNRTDYNRGDGTYEWVLKNIKLIRDNGYKGEIVARMTISFPDIYEQVMHLINNGFSSIHWQLDAGFYESDFNEKEFSKFVKEYNQSITQLIDFWGKNMHIKLYPFLGIFESLYYNKKTKLRCGAGYANYTITTNGDITACPITNNIEDFKCGDLNSKKLKEFNVIEPCTSCNYLDFCGGRCLYLNYAKLWPEKGQKLICNTIIHLIESLKKKVKEFKVNEKDLEYEKYFGPEIIP